MALEKSRDLRKVEFVLTEGKLNPVCHCEYIESIKEDGVELMQKNHRENKDSSKALKMLNSIHGSC